MRVFIILFLLLFVGNIQAQDSLAIQKEVENVVLSSDSIVRRYLIESGIQVTEDNSVKLLKSGAEKFNDLFPIIEQAKHHIHMEYFNFRNDSIANTLFEILARKAGEGVEVRLMFDAFGNSSNNKPLTKKHLKAIRETGIQIVKFDPIKFPYINHVFHRDHRKIVVIDGGIGYTGGMNIADYYIQGLPKIGQWRDMHVRIEGSAVHDLQKIFLAMWKKETKEVIGGDAYFPQSTPDRQGKQVAIVDRWARKSPKQMRRTLAKSINVAQFKVQIINPYFVPTKSIKKEIRKALERGVDVEIMISSKSDIPFTPEASLYISHKLMKKGAEVYMYDDGFHHSKIMMIDESFCTVGSTNLNSRSLRYDYETNAFIFDKETTQELIDMFEEDKEASTIMTEEGWKKRSKWRRFVGWFAHLFTPFI
ncbi:cardiolipin synthase [Bacteroides sp. 51]|uniref:cardiolipin synthase n=1 Tax=Bacteroides sp. 51 TaxID=2302938 RepID=UPI0013D4F4C6|nr:cardiolipin synthase [Bacteroides sp. 51]